MNQQTLSNWAVAMDDRNPFQAPELRDQCLAGQRENGSHCLTTGIVGKSNGCVITRSGSHYKLLDVDQNYEKQYPGAFDRLMNSLPTV